MYDDGTAHSDGAAFNDDLGVGKCEDFCCRVCDSTEYEEATENDGVIGDTQYWVTHYTCSGCSIHFQDPNKFSKSKEEKGSQDSG